jgi:poly(3-hydroxybutyrate) depolymerase
MEDGMKACRFDWACKAPPILSMALLFILVSVQQVSAQIVALPAFNVDNAQTSVSGLSSGGYMAAQFDVAFSASIKGAGIIAGGPYYCAQGDPTTATSVCSCTSFACNTQPGSTDVPALIRITDRNARQGSIDPTANLPDHRLWLFSGRIDSIVPQRIMDALVTYYANYVDRSNITYKNDIDAEHAQPTESYGNPCDTLGDPYINNCAYDAAGELLKTIYNTLNPANDGTLGGDFIHFDQTEFLADPTSHGMDTSGWLYVPDMCRKQQSCRLHVVFHGCKQYQSYSYFQLGSGIVNFGTTFVRNAGYNRWADSNGIIVLYPQATATLLEGNPEGCWDWWGYDDPNYAIKNGRQMSAVRSMVERIVSGSTSRTAP